MIRAVIVVNDSGKTRFAKFFDSMATTEKQRIIKETFLAVSNRPSTQCNFLTANSIFDTSDVWLIYRQYALLYFVFFVDSSESQLGILDLIQVFVESLDTCFEGVSELDLIFHYEKTEQILSEIIMGGLVMQVNKSDVLDEYTKQKEMELSENSMGKMSETLRALTKNRTFSGVVISQSESMMSP